MNSKRFLPFLFFASLLLWAGACSYPVVELPESRDKIIVQSEFTHGEDIRISVSKGIGMLQPNESPSIPDSILLSFYIDDEIKEAFWRKGQLPNFQIDATLLAGQEIELFVDMPQEDVAAVRAATYVPFPSDLAIQSLDIIGDTLIGEDKFLQLQLEMEIKDDNVEKYYELIINRQRAGNIIAPLDTNWHVLHGEESSIQHFANLLPDGVRWLDDRSSFLMDYYALDHKKPITLTFGMWTRSYEEISSMEFILKSHTEAAYRFLKSFDKTKVDNPTEFPILESNIENGIGIFSAYAHTRKFYQLDHQQ